MPALSAVFDGGGLAPKRPAPKSAPKRSTAIRRPHPKVGATASGSTRTAGATKAGKPGRPGSLTSPKASTGGNPAVHAAMIQRANRASGIATPSTPAGYKGQTSKAGSTSQHRTAKPKAKRSGSSSHAASPVSKGHVSPGSHAAGNSSSGVSSGVSPVTNGGDTGSIDWLRLIELGALAAGVILLLIYVRRARKGRR